MKKLYSILFVIILLFSLCACSTNKQKVNSEKVAAKDVSFKTNNDAFAEGTKLDISQLKKGISYETAKNVLKNKAEKFVIYDITATKDNESVQPNGSIKVTFPVPKGFDITKVFLAHITHDGAMEEVDFKINEEKNNISATLPQLGVYAVFQQKKASSDSGTDACLHAFIDATCTTPKVCDKCQITKGKALGHDFSKGLCKRCGIKATK